MLGYIKKAGVTSCISVVAALLALAGWIVFIITNRTKGFAIYIGGLGIVFGIIAVLLIAVSVYTSYKFGSQHYITAAIKWVALIFIMVAVGVLLNDRLALAANLLTWDSHNQPGWSALRSSIVSVVFFILSTVALIISGFLNNKKSQ